MSEEKMKISQKIKLAALGLMAVSTLGLGCVVNPAYAACDSTGCTTCTSRPEEEDCEAQLRKTGGSTTPTADDCASITDVADRANCYANLANGGNSTPLMTTLQTIINVVLGVIGFVAVVVIVYGGVQYTISSGDAGKIKKAKDTILYGVVGLIIALLAAAIVNFVLASVFTK